MLRLLPIVVITTTLVGCGGGGVFQRGVALPEQDGEWFCEMAENAEDWACVQDPELARSPRPSRLPQPQSKTVAADEPTEPAERGLDAPESGPPEPAPGPAEPSEPPRQQPTAAEETDVPTHIRLAYHPPAPTSMLELPADFYAVQLIAMSSRERLEAYIADHRLEGMTAARVEKDGEIYYVLILGVYETQDLAVQASQDIPPPLNTHEPWIRPMGALQEAIVRADAIATGSPL